MEIKTKTRTEQILTVMYVLAWIAFIGFMIQAGAILISFGVSWVNPAAASDLYHRMNFEKLRQLNFWYYTCAVSFVVTQTVMKAFVWQLVVKTLSKISMMNPFTKETVQRLELISYVMLGIWVVGQLNSAYTDWLLKWTGEEFGSRMDDGSIFVAGLVFVISQMFKRGIEIQSENELTV